MQTITIDKEFKDLLPTLNMQTYSLLEENLLQNGCRDSLILWGDILIDGHNRYEICTKHDIPFNTINKEFENREDALIWIISTQISRRNLTQKQLSNYRGLHYAADKKIISNANGKNQYSMLEEVEPHSEVQPKISSTAGRLSEQYNVSRATIERDAKFAAALAAIGEVSPEAKRLILTDEVKIDKKEVVAMTERPSDEIKSLVIAVEEGTYKKKKPEPPEPDKPARPVDPVLADIRPLSTAIGKVSDSFYSTLPKIRKKAEREELKSALRSCMDILEEMYMRV